VACRLDAFIDDDELRAFYHVAKENVSYVSEKDGSAYADFTHYISCMPRYAVTYPTDRTQHLHHLLDGFAPLGAPEHDLAAALRLRDAHDARVRRQRVDAPRLNNRAHGRLRQGRLARAP